MRNKNINRKLIAIVGPTASGKTGLGVLLAKKFNGEIVSADSRQVYRGLDLGTAKDLAEYGDVKYHLIDIKNPGEKFTLFDYLPLAREAIEDIFSRGKVPIIVGGTGLYVQALVEGFELKKQETRNKKQTNSNFQILDDTGCHPEFISGSPGDGMLKQVQHDTISREQLTDLTVEVLQDILKDLDLESYDNLTDKQNPHRLIRAIEKAQSGEVVTKAKPNFETLQIGLDWSREELNLRIDQRIGERFEGGMLEEVIGLLKSGINPEWLLGLGLEYKIITEYVFDCHPEFISGSYKNGGIVDQGIPKQVRDDVFFEQMKQTLKLRSHQYAKRQMTWFKRFSEIVWEKDYSKAHNIKKIENQARAFLG